MKKEFKFKTSFSSKLNCVIGEERNKYLAKASLNKLKEFIPNIDLDKNYDLLPFAADAVVVNTINLNDDGITTATALSVYKNFINKYVNVEHERNNVIGCLLMAGFSEFGTDKPLTEEEVKDYKKPFNLTVGGIIWKVINENLAEYIESSSDPTSENFLKVSISWEIGFEDEDFVLIKGKSRNVEDGKILTDETEISKAKKALRSYGGTGIYEDSHVYRVIKGECLPLGIGITENPAANVKGILSKSNALVEDETITEAKENEILAQKSVNTDNKEEISQKNIEKVVNISMKINSIKELTDENLKEAKASNVIEVFEDSLKKASEKWTEEKTDLEKKAKDLEAAQANILAEADKAKKELEKLTEQLNKLQAEATKREKEETFNIRMAKLDEVFELTSEDRETIVDDVKSLDNEAYVKFEKKLNVLLKAKRKDAKASTKETIEDVVEDAIDKGVKDKTAVASTITADEKGYNKYKDSFKFGEGLKLVK